MPLYYADAISDPDEYRKYLLGTFPLSELGEMAEQRLRERGVRDSGPMIDQATAGTLAMMLAHTPPDGADEREDWFVDDPHWQAACVKMFPHEPDASETVGALNGGRTSWRD